MTLSSFRPARVNANKHTQRGLRALEDSVRQDGYTEPMVAAADGEMLSGSARLEVVADVMGLDVEPIVVHSDGRRPVIHVRDDIASADGKLEYTTVAADLDTIGIWRLQIHVVLPTGSWKSDVTSFEVHANVA